MQILFVEDDAMNRRVVKDMLTIVGAEMAEAENAETGLLMIADRDYDIVLMDLRMPGMDGLTAIRRIRAREDAKAMLPIIVVTADTALNLRQACLDDGADEVIQKPIAMDSLFDAIGTMLARSDSIMLN